MSPCNKILYFSCGSFLSEWQKPVHWNRTLSVSRITEDAITIWKFNGWSPHSYIFRVYLISHGQHLVLLLKGYRDMFTVSIFLIYSLYNGFTSFVHSNIRFVYMYMYRASFRYNFHHLSTRTHGPVLRLYLLRIFHPK